MKFTFEASIEHLTHISRVSCGLMGDSSVEDGQPVSSISEIEHNLLKDLSAEAPVDDEFESSKACVVQ